MTTRWRRACGSGGTCMGACRRCVGSPASGMRPLAVVGAFGRRASGAGGASGGGEGRLSRRRLPAAETPEAGMDARAIWRWRSWVDGPAVHCPGTIDPDSHAPSPAGAGTVGGKPGLPRGIDRRYCGLVNSPPRRIRYSRASTVNRLQGPRKTEASHGIDRRYCGLVHAPPRWSPILTRGGINGQSAARVPGKRRSSHGIDCRYCGPAHAPPRWSPILARGGINGQSAAGGFCENGDGARTARGAAARHRRASTPRPHSPRGDSGSCSWTSTRRPI